MVKGRFTVNPFPDLKLSPSDTGNLNEIAGSILEANVQRYENFMTKENQKIDLNHWKVLKTKENSTVYTARHHDVYRSGSTTNHGDNGLPSLLSLGTTVGALEDMMFGVVNPTLEIMRIKASYVDDLSGAAVLANLEEPSLEDPFRSLVVKWMELDIPLHTTSLVKNRDYVYVEGTGMVSLSTGERVGYHVLHSVTFPQTHELPGRVRANMSICGIFRQVRPNAIEVFVTGVMDPGGDMIRVLVVPSIASVFLSTLNVNMVKGRFTVNPFNELRLTPSDVADLEALVGSILDANLSRYEEFLFKEHCRIDANHWKLVKSRDNTKVYSERNYGSTRVGPQIPGASADLPSLLCFGTAIGDLEDMMFGVVNPTLEIMRIKASYVDDISGAAVLSTIREPSLEDPFKSLVVKWMEFDLPFQSVGLVKNRDYIYAEGTNIVHLSNGEKVGYHILHSVNFPETHDLPGRVRANTSICGIFRQVRPNACEIYVTGLMDPGGDMIRKLVVPNMATAFLSSLKYAHCGQMKKLAWMLEKRYIEAKELGTPNRELVCVTCACPITSRRIGDFGKSNSSCKLCFGHVCHNCKISKKLSFVTPDLLLAQRKVTFCAVCVNEAMKAPAADAARAQIIATGGGSKSIPYPSNASTASSLSEGSFSSHQY
ncbi:hypothetical protein PHPALM_6424 [Phytophthora palmivora]|uniref:FYVE-type domain-containing protein n=2 Tax=Phytophthora palmivora TaxID=4796 RepID=A0A2P4YEU8_9STRA|nr:hypothetical protein PHPALM_6424 [Phytophthora palmivora]